MSLSKTAEKTIAINSLPNELLYTIFNYLNIQEKIPIENVCKRWEKVLRSTYSSHTSIKINNDWSGPQYSYGCTDHKHNQSVGQIKCVSQLASFPAFFSEIMKDILSPILDRCKHIQSIHLENLRVDIGTLLWLIKKCPKIECLSLIEISGIQPMHWKKINKRLKLRLRHLAISDCRNSFSCFIIPLIPALEQLCLLYHTSSLIDIFNCFGPNIRKLSIRCCERSDINAIKSLVFGNGRLLTHLSIDDPWIDNEVETLSTICSRLQDLQSLSLGFGAFSPVIKPLLQLKKLNHLELTATIERWSAILSIESRMYNIQHLLLHVYFSPKYLYGIELIFPNVKTLKIYFFCECDGALKSYHFFCSKCQNICFEFIDKLKFVQKVTLNGENYIRKL